MAGLGGLLEYRWWSGGGLIDPGRGRMRTLGLRGGIMLAEGCFR